MKRNAGFTLIELLVVIAIITILAAIVVPNVSNWISRARMTNAVSEVQGVEMAMTQLLADADRNNLRQIFSDFPNAQQLGSFENAVELYTNVFYTLLRQGRNIRPEDGDTTFTLRNGSTWTVEIDPEVRRNLASSYMDLGLDPWDNRYRMWPGPWNRRMEEAYAQEFGPDPIENRQRVGIPFRSFREGREEQDTGVFFPYQYTREERQRANERVPGNPPADGRLGFPAPADQAIYIYSSGTDATSNQNYNAEEKGHWQDRSERMDVERLGGGDDINNWDNEQGWSRWYTN